MVSAFNDEIVIDQTLSPHGLCYSFGPHALTTSNHSGPKCPQHTACRMATKPAFSNTSDPFYHAFGSSRSFLASANNVDSPPGRLLIAARSRAAHRPCLSVTAFEFNDTSKIMPDYNQPSSFLQRDLQPADGVLESLTEGFNSSESRRP